MDNDVFLYNIILSKGVEMKKPIKGSSVGLRSPYKEQRAWDSGYDQGLTDAYAYAVECLKLLPYRNNVEIREIIKELEEIINDIPIL